MKPVIKTTLIALSSAIIGGAVTAGTINYNQQKEQKEAITTVNPWTMSPKEFFASNNRDPFESFFKRHESIQKQFDRLFEESGRNPFQSLMPGSLQNTNHYDISEREDADNFYYDIKVGDLNSTTINTDIKDGQITISGTTEKKNVEDRSQSYFKSSFSQTLPLPENVDQNKMQMLTEEDKVILKFPKLKA